MAGMGPPPQPNARRRNARPAAQILPAAGRSGPIPAWPLPPEIALHAAFGVATDRAEALRDEWASAVDPKEARRLAKMLETAEVALRSLEMRIELAATAEVALWDELWTTPQAVAWERLRWTREVAQYVRWKVKAEGGDLDASKESRQLADRLGLSPLAMLRLQWEIQDVQVVTETAEDNVVELFG